MFELLSWREGFFRFEEGRGRGRADEVEIRISTESLLMEGARRIDEWSRIGRTVPSLARGAACSPTRGRRSRGVLDLLPSEWEVLAQIDGARDLREISSTQRQ